MNPWGAAKTVEQQAFATVGVFQITQEVALELVRDPTLPSELRLAIQRSENVAYPAVRAVLEGVLAVERTRRGIVAGSSTQEDVEAALEQLGILVNEAKPQISAFIEAVSKGGKR
ncbi:MAG: hypothetical protein HC923_00295 [Myxococcales bacterium]|nr:hypothetical protein [Myxococcales bacterium]